MKYLHAWQPWVGYMIYVGSFHFILFSIGAFIQQTKGSVFCLAGLTGWCVLDQTREGKFSPRLQEIVLAFIWGRCQRRGGKEQNHQRAPMLFLLADGWCWLGSRSRQGGWRAIQVGINNSLGIYQLSWLKTPWHGLSQPLDTPWEALQGCSILLPLFFWHMSTESQKTLQVSKKAHSSGLLWPTVKGPEKQLTAVDCGEAVWRCVKAKSGESWAVLGRETS